MAVFNAGKMQQTANRAYRHTSQPIINWKGGEAQFLVDYADYHMTKRGYHPRAVNSWQFMVRDNADGLNEVSRLKTHIKEISPPWIRSMVEKAHSLYFSKTAYEAANQPKRAADCKKMPPMLIYMIVWTRSQFDNITAFFNKKS